MIQASANAADEFIKQIKHTQTMKRVELKRLTLDNFKGFASKSVEFDTHTYITGANGTGKSTLYEAYLWCLFNKDSYGNSLSVQPIGNDGNPIHKVTTSVEAILSVDGVEVKIRRTQSEEWSVPRGKKDAVLKGTTQERLFNDVPLSVKDFSEKINGICNADDWFMLSSINIIPGMKQEDRRRKLQSIAPQVDDKLIADKYPAVKEAFSKGKSIDELKIQTKSIREKSKTELDMIPARIDQQEKLRVEADFDAIEKEANDVDSRIRDIEDSIASQIENVSTEELERNNAMRKELSEVNADLSDIESSVHKERNKRVDYLRKDIDELECKEVNFRFDRQVLEGKIKTNTDLRKDAFAEKQRLGEEWMKKNGETYTDTVATICPVCGQNLPADKVNTARINAVNDFNIRKVERLHDLERRAEEQQMKAKEYDAAIVDAENKIHELDDTTLALQQLLEQKRKELSKVPSAELALAANKEYQALTERKNDIEIRIKEADVAESTSERKQRVDALNAEKAALRARLNELNKQYQAKFTNEKIDKERQKLEKRSTELAQIIADCENTEQQISAFKKERIGMVEEAVSSLFLIVRWKMYEPNLTNDGEKEICQAVIDGIPYEQQNRATQVNASIDIINGFCTALDIQLPLFVDNAESVNHINVHIGQTVELTVVNSGELKVESRTN